jgi:phosphopantothenoylcysteine decarboxylase/phosphopantothenate--cysteine ligase
LSLQTLSGNPVSTELFELSSESEINHISLADKADLVVVAPATANVLGKVASGIADDLLTTVIMATKASVLFVPAMNVNMYENPIIQKNIGSLKSLHYHFIGPAEGDLACGYEGKGRMSSPEDIVEEMKVLLSPQDLQGKKILITAGPTRERIDPVRHISNQSTGRMGYALAKIARRRGGKVNLISGPSSVPVSHGISLHKVESAEEMREKVLELFPSSHVVIMSAAVADFRPVNVVRNKIKKGASRSITLDLEKTSDILKELGEIKKNQLLVGFALETEDLTANAKKKLAEKQLDFIVANDPSSGFGKETNKITMIDRNGRTVSLPPLHKDEVAEKIIDWFSELLKEKDSKRELQSPDLNDATDKRPPLRPGLKVR